MSMCCGAPGFAGARDAQETLREIGRCRSCCRVLCGSLVVSAIVAVVLITSFRIASDTGFMLEREMEVSEHEPGKW
jgi:hypothetical protein